MKTTLSKALAFAAVAGLVSGGSIAFANDHDGAAKTEKGDKNSCKGKDGCKGKESCKGHKKGKKEHKEEAGH